MTDLMAAQIPMLFRPSGRGGCGEERQDPRARGDSLQRSAAFPDVPTMDELGFEGFDSTAWYGVLGPPACAGGCRAVDWRCKAGGQELGRPDQRHRLRHRDPAPAKTLEKLKADYEKWGRVVKEAGSRLNRLAKLGRGWHLQG